MRTLSAQSLQDKIAAVKVSLALVLGLGIIIGLIIVTAYLQFSNQIHLTENLTDLWLWILFTGMTAGFTLINAGILWSSKGQVVTGTIVGPAKNEIETYVTSDLAEKIPWVKLLPQAKQEIVIVAITCKSIANNATLIKQLLEANKELMITCNVVEPRKLLKGKAEEEYMKTMKLPEMPLNRLITLKGQMLDSQSIRFEIEEFEEHPPFEMVILDHQAEDAYMQIDGRVGFTTAFHKKGNEELFRRYWEEYQIYRKSVSSYTH